MSWPEKVIGYHTGRDRQILKAVEAGNSRLLWSVDPRDWLGFGSYFWAFSLEHAERWDEIVQRNTTDRETGILRAEIELGDCLNLLEPSGTQRLFEASTVMKGVVDADPEKQLPQNEDFREGVAVRRHLDCAMIEFAHSIRQLERASGPASGYDTVLNYCESGPLLSEETSIRQNGHLQICVRNWNCLGELKVL